MRLTTVIASLLLIASAAGAKIERVWITHNRADAKAVVISWDTDQPGDSVVRFGSTNAYGQTARGEAGVKRHRVEVPLDRLTDACHYAVATNGESLAGSFPLPTAGGLRVAVVADWLTPPKLDAIVADRPHIVMTAGDNVPSLHGLCGAGVKDCTKPYEKLIDAYPDLFRSVVFMPALGNHDREIRPRGPRPPAEPGYDVEATAFRAMFPLPGDRWKWTLDLAKFDVRFVALDINHLSDMNTTWQTCHPVDAASEQFKWYERLMTGESPRFVVTIYNEKNSTVRSLEKGAWGRLIQRGTVAITGFGYFAEKAVADGFPYYNTSLSGAGDKYPDPKSVLLKGEDSYVLLTLDGKTMRVELKSLAGEVLDRTEHAGK
jgi:hypothetical protein